MAPIHSLCPLFIGYGLGVEERALVVHHDAPRPRPRRATPPRLALRLLCPRPPARRGGALSGHVAAVVGVAPGRVLGCRRVVPCKVMALCSYGSI